MVNFIEHIEFLCNSQHGFISGKSCLTQILSHFDDIYKDLFAGADTNAIYLDSAQAFDKVYYQLLLKKLRHYGFNEILISWIESFLTERYQQVVINVESSNSAKVRSGVPQGSVLGPLVYKIPYRRARDWPLGRVRARAKESCIQWALFHPSFL